MRNWTIVYENPVEIILKSRQRVLKEMRKDKSNGTTVIRYFPGVRNLAAVQFESSLKADFIRMLEFDNLVDRFVEQPVKIKYVDSGGKKRTYTPDFIVYFTENEDGIIYQKPTLFEVSYRSQIKKDWQKLKPKFKAAIKYCDQMGWRFVIRTEKEIKTQFTENIKFLLPYLKHTPDYSTIETIILTLEELKESTPAEAISHYMKDYMRQAELVPALWFLIGSKRVGCDLSKKLTMSSKIWMIDN